MYQPSYYDNFKCIGSKCPNSCCIGWSIDLDLETFRKYKELKDPEFEKNISLNPFCSNDKFGTIKVDKDKRCSFLDNDNLCNIQKHHTKDLLAPICASFPRKRIEFGKKEISSCLLSCPEISRMIFDDKEPLRILNKKKKTVYGDFKIIPDELRSNIYAVKGEKVFNLLYQLYNDENISLEICLSVTNQIINENFNNAKSLKEIEKTFNYIKDFFINFKFSKTPETDSQLEFSKIFFENFLNKNLKNKLCDLIKKIYKKNYIEKNKNELRLVFERAKLQKYNKFISTFTYLDKKYFLHELFSNINIFTNEDFNAKEKFYVIFLISLLTKLILIFNAIDRDTITKKDFIEVISLVSRYYGGRAEFDDDDKKILLNQETFTNFFHLFFN